MIECELTAMAQKRSARLAPQPKKIHHRDTEITEEKQEQITNHQ